MLRKVAPLKAITPGKMHVFVLDGEKIALANIGGLIYAIEDRCTHDDGPLAEGELRDNVIECPRHGATFDVKTGAVLSMPAVVPVRSFETQVKDGDVYVKVE
jgi:3-phenylpropionate/trans-cinnamate dioxygenase ferredoxin subunit